MLRCHPQSAIKIEFVMRSNPGAFTNIIPESKGWTVSDLDKYFRTKPKNPCPESLVQNIRNTESDGNMSNLTDSSSVVENRKDLKSNTTPVITSNMIGTPSNISDLNNYTGLKRSRDEALTALERNEFVMNELKRESNLKLEEKDEEIGRLALEKKVLTKDLKKAQLELQQKEEAMESVRLEFARKMYLKGQKADNCHDEYEAAVKQLATAQIELSKLKELKLKEVETVRIQQRKSEAELEQLKDELGEARTRIETLTENDASHDIVINSNLSYETKLRDISENMNDLQCANESLLKDIARLNVELRDVSNDRKRLLDDLLEARLSSEAELFAMKSEASKAMDLKEAELIRLQKEVQVMNDEMEANMGKYSELKKAHAAILTKVATMDENRDCLNENSISDNRKLKLDNQNLRVELNTKSGIINEMISKLAIVSEDKDCIITNIKKSLNSSVEEVQRLKLLLKERDNDLLSTSTNATKNDFEIGKLRTELEFLEGSLTKANSKLEERLIQITKLKEIIKTNSATNHERTEELAKQKAECELAQQQVIYKDRIIAKLKENMKLMDDDIEEGARRVALLELQNEALEKKRTRFWSFTCG